MNCPVCHQETRKQPVEQIDRFELLHCAACDVVFSDPMEQPDPEWYQSHPDYVLRDLARFKELRWYHKEFLQQRPAEGGHLLDIGCGTGSFLCTAEGVGYRVSGLDFDRQAIETARTRFGLTETYALDLESFARTLGQGAFDVVTAFEVLEHQANPVRFLSMARRLTRAGGYLAVSVPYRDRRPAMTYHWDYPPHHLTRWSKKAITHLFARLDLEVIVLRTGWIAMETIIPELLRRVLSPRVLLHAEGDDPESRMPSLVARPLKAAITASRAGMSAIAWPANILAGRLGATGISMFALVRRP